MPILDGIAILHFMALVYRFIRHQRIQSNAEDDDDLEMLMISNMFLQLISDWLHLIQLISRYLLIRKHKKQLFKPHLLLRYLCGYRAILNGHDVWRIISVNWMHFFWLTGETPATLSSLVNQIEHRFMHYFVKGHESHVDLRNQVLLTMIWLRRYPTMQHLSIHFGIPVSCVHKIIHRMIKVLHAYLVPKYITWHSMDQWRNLAGTFAEWPRVVAIVDCTPFRISKPKGVMQRIFYRKDRHCFFLNWLIIVDVLGFVVLSRPGFLGRAHDSTCMSNINLPVLPQGLQIIADQGFEHNFPVLVLPRANQPQIPKVMCRTFRGRRSMIERCFGVLKNSYSAAGTQRFRSRRWNGPLICNISAALYNRCKLIFQTLRRTLGLHYM